MNGFTGNSSQLQLEYFSLPGVFLYQTIFFQCPTCLAGTSRPADQSNEVTQ